MVSLAGTYLTDNTPGLPPDTIPDWCAKAIIAENLHLNERLSNVVTCAALRNVALNYLLRGEGDAILATAAMYLHECLDAGQDTRGENAYILGEAIRRLPEDSMSDRFQECLNAYIQHLASDKLFAGEWTRDKHFGELSLHIETAKRLDNAVQFSGTIFDTNLPEASLQIIGRCELAPKEDGTTQVDISIYEGQYDPDQPTAEVYDAKDGMISLQLGKDGKLSGIMTCAAWANTPEKAFKVTLSPKEKEEPKSRRRRR
jgi:hypothetical protein